MRSEGPLVLDAGDVSRRWHAVAQGVDESTAQAVLGALLLRGNASAAADALLRFDPNLPVTLAALRSLRTVLHDELAQLPPVDYARTFQALDHLVNRIADRDIERVATLSLIDPLTALGNRRAAEADLARALAHAERHGQMVSVAILDLDGLKAINDEHGHQAGDAALRELADAMRATARVDDVSYRLGGDEFLVIAAGSSTLDLERLLRRLAAVAPAFSAGVATAPADATDPEPLLAVADRRLYQRKPARREHPSVMRVAGSRADVLGSALVLLLASALAESVRRHLSIELRGARTILWTMLVLGAPVVASMADIDRPRARTDIASVAGRAVTLAVALLAALVPLARFR